MAVREPTPRSRWRYVRGQGLEFDRVAFFTDAVFAIAMTLLIVSIDAPKLPSPWEAPDVYHSHSPLTFAANVKTPLLIQHGEADPRVPLSQAREFYRALKVQGKTVEFDVYPRGGHVLYEPAMQREQMRRNLEWFTRWLNPAGPPS